MPPAGPAFALQSLRAGEALGWSWFIPPHQWRFGARAVERKQVVVIDGLALREACEKNTDLGYELFKRIATVVAQRLTNTREKLREVYSNV